jgi:hypothetical protein
LHLFAMQASRHATVAAGVGAPLSASRDIRSSSALKFSASLKFSALVRSSRPEANSSECSSSSSVLPASFPPSSSCAFVVPSHMAQVQSSSEACVAKAARSVRRPAVQSGCVATPSSSRWTLLARYCSSGPVCAACPSAMPGSSASDGALPASLGALPATSGPCSDMSTRKRHTAGRGLRISAFSPLPRCAHRVAVEVDTDARIGSTSDFRTIRAPMRASVARSAAVICACAPMRASNAQFGLPMRASGQSRK